MDHQVISDLQLAAIAAVITALTGLIGAVGVLIGKVNTNTKTTTATAAQVADTAAEVHENTQTTDATHLLVNNKSDEEQVFRDLLLSTLKTHGIEVPANPGVAAAADRIDKKGTP
jgi:hypothetical protein